MFNASIILRRKFNTLSLKLRCKVNKCHFTSLLQLRRELNKLIFLREVNELIFLQDINFKLSCGKLISVFVDEPEISFAFVDTPPNNLVLCRL